MIGIGLASAFVAAVVSAPPEVTVITLAGEQRAGALAELSRESLRLTKDGAETSLPVADLMELRFAQPAPGSTGTGAGANGGMAAGTSGATVALSDGSTLQANNLVITKRDVAFETVAWGALKLPLPAVASIRFAGSDQQVNASWTELAARVRKTDMLVVQKGAVLDHLDGTVGDITAEKVTFVLNDDDEKDDEKDDAKKTVQVNRAKVFGVLYATRKAPVQQPTCEALSTGGDRLKLRLATWNGEEWQAALVVGGEVKLAADRLVALDFSLGKIKYLSDLDWREMKLTPYWDTESDRLLFAPQKDRTGEGGRLRLGVPLRPNSRFLVSKSYQRGLWVHSRTSLKYRLNGDYRRLTATMGISYDMLRYSRGDVHVKISGDGRALFEGDVAWNEPSRPLDLDLTDVRELEIFVDFGRDQLQEGDELVLADAKLVK